jgi:Skp family chaperone for outer membrane proteins
MFGFSFSLLWHTSAGLLSVLTVLVLAGPLVAQTAPAETGAEFNFSAGKIAVVDVRLIMRDAVAAKNARAQIDEARARFQSEVVAFENELRAFEQELIQMRDQVDSDAYLARRRSFEERVAEVQREAQERRQALDRALDRANRQVRAIMLAEVAQLASDHGLSIILPKEQVVMVDNRLDLTDTVKARVDARLPTVVIIVPDSAGGNN